MKEPVKNLTASVRGKLQNKSNETKRPFAEVLQYYGMERFLYRFSKSEYAQKFILKGALMFTVWDVPDRRTTRDIDFLGRHDNQIEKIEAIIRDICGQKVVDDGLIFRAQTVKGKRIKEDSDYEGVRVKFLGFLDRSRIPMQIDVGFGDLVEHKARPVVYPTIVNFPKPHLRGYPLESVVAEKFEAMIKLGALNSRMKDFYDVWLLLRQFEFNGESLSQAIRQTFEKRKTVLPKAIPLFAPEIYDGRSDKDRTWKSFLGKNNVRAPEHLKEVASSIEDFLWPTVEAIMRKRTFACTWKAPGPWK